MKTAALFQDIEFNESKPAIRIMLDTSFTKEIRIAMRKGHVMKKHQTPFPIVVEIVDGEIEFGVQDQTLNLTRGNLIALDGGVPHDLKATEESIIRLTLTKADMVTRVADVVSD